MFDIGFWELILIAGIALLVVGPERMPIVLGNVGRWVGKARAYINTVRGDIERQVASAERAAKENEALKSLQETAVSINTDAQSARGAMQKTADAFKNPAAALTGAAAAKTAGGQTEQPPLKNTALENTALENSALKNTALNSSDSEKAEKPSSNEPTNNIDPQQEMLPTPDALAALTPSDIAADQIPPPPTLPESVLAATAPDAIDKPLKNDGNESTAKGDA